MKLSKNNFNIPNLLSFIRILLIIPFIIFFKNFLQNKDINDLYYALVTIIISSITDFLDGYIARKYDMITPLGKLLDPLSDKLSQAACLFCLYSWAPQILPLFLIFIIKEACMVLGSIYLFIKGKRPTEAKWFGKVSTAVFFVSMIVMIAFKAFINEIPEIVIWISTILCSILMIVSFVGYSKIFFTIKKDPSETN